MLFFFTPADPSANKLGISKICPTPKKPQKVTISTNRVKVWIQLNKLKHWFISLLLLQIDMSTVRTFITSSSKHWSTLTLVLALHSINKHPYSLAKSIPSFLLTTLSLSCNTQIRLKLFSAPNVLHGEFEWKRIGWGYVPYRPCCPQASLCNLDLLCIDRFPLPIYQIDL